MPCRLDVLHRMWGRRSAFTLIELLVVVAIIVILIAILMPALSGARQQARSVACKSNMRQVATGLLMYTVEYDGWLPPSTDDKPDGTFFVDGKERRVWVHYLVDAGILRSISVNNTSLSTYYISRILVAALKCPSRQTGPYGSGFPQWSYNVPLFINGVSPARTSSERNERMTKVSEVASSNVLILAESWYGNAASYPFIADLNGGWESRFGVDVPHGGAAGINSSNFAMMDGSVTEYRYKGPLLKTYPAVWMNNNLWDAGILAPGTYRSRSALGLSANW